MEIRLARQTQKKRQIDQVADGSESSSPPSKRLPSLQSDIHNESHRLYLQQLSTKYSGANASCNLTQHWRLRRLARFFKELEMGGTNVEEWLKKRTDNNVNYAQKIGNAQLSLMPLAALNDIFPNQIRRIHYQPKCTFIHRENQDAFDHFISKNTVQYSYTFKKCVQWLECMSSESNKSNEHIRLVKDWVNVDNIEWTKRLNHFVKSHYPSSFTNRRTSHHSALDSYRDSIRPPVEKPVIAYRPLPEVKESELEAWNKKIKYFSDDVKVDLHRESLVQLYNHYVEENQKKNQEPQLTSTQDQSIGGMRLLLNMLEKKGESIDSIFESHLSHNPNDSRYPSCEAFTTSVLKDIRRKKPGIIPFHINAFCQLAYARLTRQKELSSSTANAISAPGMESGIAIPDRDEDIAMADAQTIGLQISEFTDDEGTRIHVTPSDTPAYVRIHFDTSRAPAEDLYVSDAIAVLMDRATTLLEEAQAFFPTGKGNQLQDVWLSRGESLLRMIVLHDLPKAQEQFNAMNKTVHDRRKRPPLSAPAQMEQYLRIHATADKQNGLLNYAKHVAEVGGGACDDMAALTTAYAIQQGLAKDNWVVCVRDSWHLFTLIGTGTEWAVFDPWGQCPMPCILDTFWSNWKTTVAAFPPGFTPPADYELKPNACLALEEIQAKYLEMEPEFADLNPPSDEYVQQIFKDTAQFHKHEQSMYSYLWFTDPRIRYISELYPDGKQYDEVPVERWNRAAQGIVDSREEATKGTEGMLGGLSVRINVH